MSGFLYDPLGDPRESTGTRSESQRTKYRVRDMETYGKTIEEEQLELEG